MKSNHDLHKNIFTDDSKTLSLNLDELLTKTDEIEFCEKLLADKKYPDQKKCKRSQMKPNPATVLLTMTIEVSR